MMLCISCFDIGISFSQVQRDEITIPIEQLKIAETHNSVVIGKYCVWEDRYLGTPSHPLIIFLFFISFHAESLHFPCEIF